jgi:hypothetical protein
MSMIAAFIGGFAVLFGLTQFRCFMRRKLDDLEQVELHSKHFFDAAEKLLKIDDLPNELITMIAFLNRQLIDPSAARKLYVVLSKGTGISMSDDERRMAAALRSFEEKQPALKPLIAKAIASGMLAVTFTSVIYGPLCRLSFGSSNNTTSRAVTLAARKYDDTGSEALLA